MEKKSFKVVLNSSDTNSFIGTLYNANYYVDLSKVIRNKEDYDKSYYVYCTLISNTDITATTNIVSTNLYTLILNMSNKFNNIYQYNNINYDSFILPVQVNPSDNGGGGPHNGFFLKDTDQRPLYIDNINNLTNIHLKVLQNSQQTTASAPYVCILTFVQA
jgi:hypothetical protein